MTAPVIVLVGSDGDALGRLAAELESEGRRVAVFVGDPAAEADRAALREMLAELYPAREQPAPRSRS
ncbi:MAG: hypothetical protein ACRDWD_10225 [Acidimicrobiia bacterium]